MAAGHAQDVHRRADADREVVAVGGHGQAEERPAGPLERRPLQSVAASRTTTALVTPSFFFAQPA
jgi:hypothetical protein